VSGRSFGLDRVTTGVAMQSPLILVIDDSPTIRKMVECHLSQAGYRVVMAADAQIGLEMAGSVRPDLILLDHQLPGTTGDEVCRQLLKNEVTAQVPVIVSSALRNRAFALYTEFSNVIDQIPKPFTPELLKSGVANALHTGALVVQAQRTGCTMPEAVGETFDAALDGDTAVFSFRAVLDFLTNLEANGRLTLEQGKDRLRFAIAAGRVQAVYSPTVSADRLVGQLPAELADLGPLLSVTLGEKQDASMSGLVKLLEKSLSDPRRLRALLRFQSAVLTHWALTGEPGRFSFEPDAVLPPMFQAFPLQVSLPALAVESVRRCVATAELERLGPLHFSRQNPRGGNVDRAGLCATDLRVHTLLDGSEPLAAVAARAGISLADAAAVARGLELTGQAERRNPTAGASILLLEDDAEVARVALRVLGPDSEGYQVRHIRDRVAAQLLLRRNAFDLVMLPVDNADQEAFYHSLRVHVPAQTRFVGIVRIEDESQLDRLDALGLDGVLHRPPTESDLRDTVRQLLGGTPVGVA
jgi:DNA-binding response OmpR family regulator